MQQEVIEGGRGRNGLASSICPKCSEAFMSKRSNQTYCSTQCQKSASRNAARGDRVFEKRRKNEDHFIRAEWLSYDMNRMSPAKQRKMILALLEAASGANRALRDILLDPRLLKADRGDPIGKLYPDTNIHGALNVAKMVYAFCQAEWGCNTRDAIIDDGKPAFRLFKEEAVNVPAPAPEGSEKYRNRSGDKVKTSKEPYDWRKIARLMGDPGWQRYYSEEELDDLL